MRQQLTFTQMLRANKNSPDQIRQSLGGPVRVTVISTAEQKKLQGLSSTSSPMVIVGDAQKGLATLPGRHFQSCVTSPPYWSLRDYRIKGQIGLEPSVDDYIGKLVKVFDGVHRVLKDDGVLWVNLGDSYTSGGRTWRATDRKNPVRAMSIRPPTPKGLKPKDLIGVPWRLAFALQQAGWFLRADVVWNKPNCQPESVKDRPTRSHEFMFMFSKSLRYRYYHQAVRGPNGRNLRTLWDINTRAYPEAHFATSPTELVEPCIDLSLCNIVKFILRTAEA